ncbi:MAG: hypothetical protein COV52_00015 [Gammaproteobacteria bacterium CG11_big_fil_rev_8_21_14_0_20_46_22]|nr:MAG: hypothetical protein COW05_02560 [Gammaproteobacteria bacterium CG12_big_fil_rev_8_21_14_0_65_46_12]PIR12189.1 MAG: hypothetical protein COV52_00015 [Gammaproteobacteria bacterium CG11_big_fil_rev_8_21_14_0_20_46_22]
MLHDKQLRELIICGSLLSFVQFGGFKLNKLIYPDKIPCILLQKDFKVMIRVLQLIGILFLTLILVACHSTITEKEIKQSKQKFVEAAKICYKLAKANKNPMKNQTCMNLAHVYQQACQAGHARREALYGMDLGFRGCDDLNSDVLSAITLARQVDAQQQAAQQEDKKLGW